MPQFRLCLLMMFLLCISIGAESSLHAQDPTPLAKLTFEREESGAFHAIITPADPSLTFDEAPTFSVTRGALDSVIPGNEGGYRALILPDSIMSGEYPVEVTGSVGGSSFSITRTALILGEVAPEWGQPAAVDGLVNTAGWEDSLGITSDGEWLFLEYIPVAINCLIGQQHAIYCDQARGPIAAPERPLMPGADRIMDGIVHHACRGIGLDPMPFPIPPQTLYGFHRQPDGSFAEPFPIYLENGDGCFSPFGPVVKRLDDKVAAHLYLAFGDERNINTIWHMDFQLGQPTSLGKVVGYTDHVLIEDSPMQKLGVPAPGAQGNPHIYEAEDGSQFVFWDDETLPEDERFIYGAVFKDGAWSEAIRLDFPPFHATGEEEIQPFFDGTQLIVRRGDDLVAYEYLVGDWASAEAWGDGRILIGAPDAFWLPGRLVTLGEPNLAVRDGKPILYFIYALYESDGALNLNVGYVEGK